MYKDLTPGIERAIAHGYRFDLGRYIDQGFRLAKDNIGLFIGFGATYFGIMIVASVIPLVGNLASFVTTPLLAGLYLVAHRLKHQRPVEFNDFFKGFDKIKDLIIMMLIQVGILVALMIPAIIYMGVTFASLFAEEMDFLEMSEYVNDAGIFSFGLILVLMLLPAIYLSISWQWAAHLIVFNDLSPWHALETSRKLISRNFFPVLFFLILAGIVTALGLIGFLIGILFTFPAMMAASYFAFADVTDLDSYDGEGTTDFLDHLIAE